MALILGDADVDAPESNADAGRAGGGMVIAASCPRSFSLSLHVHVVIGGRGGCRL